MFNDTALIIATFKDNLEIVRKLLSKEGIEINIRDILIQIIKQHFCIKLEIFFLWDLKEIFNFTALMIAAGKGTTEIVQELLSKEGMDISIKSI